MPDHYDPDEEEEEPNPANKSTDSQPEEDMLAIQKTDPLEL